MKKDLLFTFLAEFTVFISGLLVYKFAANLVENDSFSQYALCRRTVSFIFPVVVLGLTVGIPRYIAFANSNSQYRHPDKYFLAGVSALVASALLSSLLLNLFKPSFAFLFFGNSGYQNLILPISLMILGLTLHASCYSYYRGKLIMVRANILQMLNSGVIPILAFTYQTDISHILSFTGSCWIIISIGALLLILKDLEWGEATSLIPCIKELLAYGIQRVAGDFGMAALISLPAIITAHIAGMKEAGYVAFGTTILNMTGSFFAPLGLVLLPKASQLIAMHNMNKLKEYILRLAGITVLLTLAGLIVFEIFAGSIIKIYLGQTFGDIVMNTRIIMLGCLAYTFYVAMRSMIDAYHIKAVNTINIITSLCCFIIASWFIYVFKGDYILITIVFIFSIYILGILTLLDIKKLLKCDNP